MNCRRCRRSEDNGYVGNVTYDVVAQGSAMVEAIVFLTLLAASRNIQAALENLEGSVFFRYGPVVDMEHTLHTVAACTYRCASYVAPFGQRHSNKYNVLATGRRVRCVFASRRCPGNLHVSFTIRKVGKDGRVHINGIKKTTSCFWRLPHCSGPTGY